MKTLIFIIGLLALMTGCKREEITPGLTEINMTVVNESREPIPNVEIFISGLSGSYFAGTRIDTTFARRYTDIKGLMLYKLQVETKWRVYAMPFSPYDSSGRFLYDILKFEGTVDAIVNVGVVNNITVVMRKR